MRLFHQHKWVEKERFVTPQWRIEKITGGAPEQLTREIIFGITTILYHCSICQKIKTVEILGKSREEDVKQEED